MYFIKSITLSLICLLALLMKTMPAISQDHWSVLPSFPGQAKTSMAGIEDSILFVGSGNGVWKSANTGFSWERTLQSRVIYSIHASSSGKILAGGEGKIYFSLDRGRQWDSVEVETDYPIMKIAETSDGDFFFITGISTVDGYVGDGVFYNDGDLVHWEPRNNGLQTLTLYCEQLAIDRYGRIYLGVGDEYVTGSAGLFVSDDKGLHWQKISLNAENLGIVKTSNILSINITPDDSVIYSVSGTVSNFLVTLNLIKHRNDLLSNASWRPMRVGNSSTWWLSANLNTIHFASNGDWYSSVTGTLSKGGTYLSTDKGKTWTRYNTGLGISQSQLYENQFFYETSYGRIIMTQQFDERIYGTNRSMLNPVIISGRITDDVGKGLAATIKSDLYLSYTDPDGYYTLKLPKNYAGTIRPMYGQHVFEPQSLQVQNLTEDLVDQHFIGTYTGTHGIWGFVHDVYGSPIAQAEVRGFTENIYTNEYGAFVVSVPHRWSGEIEVIVPGMEVNPVKKQIPPVTANIYAYQFTARKAGAYLIAGDVMITGVSPTSVELQGFPELVRINDDGKFIAALNAGWVGTIAPSAEGYTFIPSSIRIDDLQKDTVNILFVAQPNQYFEVSGRILFQGIPLQGIELSGLPANTKTDVNGYFKVVVSAPWQGVITPVSTEYVFTPATIQVQVVDKDVVTPDFSADFITDIDETDGYFSLFPNPSIDGKVGIQWSGGPGMQQLEIIDSTGAIVDDIKYTGDDSFYINRAGVYIAKLRVGNNVYIRKLIIP